MTLFEAYMFHIAGLLNGMVFGGYLAYRILTRKAVARSAWKFREGIRRGETP